MNPNLRPELRVASISVNRYNAPIEAREQLACQNWAHLMAIEVEGVREWAIVKTCHRFELFFVADADLIDLRCEEVRDMLLRAMAQGQYDLELEDTAEFGQESLVVRTDNKVAEHLCRVSAGLDSLVLGEAQIQGQVIATYMEGVESGSIGPLLTILFRTAIRVGKRARTETSISTHALSMSSLALSMAARHFTEFSKARVLVIGAGEMSRLALKALLQRQVTDVTVANRTIERAEAILMHPQWRAIPLGEVAGSLACYDVVFSATSALEYVVSVDQFAMDRQRNAANHKQVLIDLAVPRDVDPGIRNLANISLIDVDDLRQGLDQSLEKRTEALPAVHAIIDEELARWQADYRELTMRPVVVELRQKAERIRQQEVERAMRFIGPVDDGTREHIQQLSRALVNKLLHEPTIRIKELAQNDDAELYVSTLCDIFGLNGAMPVPSNAEETKLSGTVKIS